MLYLLQPRRVGDESQCDTVVDGEDSNNCHEMINFIHLEPLQKNYNLIQSLGLGWGGWCPPVLLQAPPLECNHIFSKLRHWVYKETGQKTIQARISHMYILWGKHDQEMIHEFFRKKSDHWCASATGLILLPCLLWKCQHLLFGFCFKGT